MQPRLPRESPGYAVRFQRLMQPPCPRFISVAVAHEGFVAQWLGLIQAFIFSARIRDPGIF